MRLSAVLAGVGLAALLFAAPRAWGAATDDLYLKAYRQIQEADQLVSSGRAEMARPLYQEALTNLNRLKAGSPQYSPRAVEYRLEHVREKLATLPEAEPDPAPAEPAPLTPANTVEGLRRQLAQLQSDNAVLQAKLEEALAPRPASIDPQELAEAEERIRELEKQKELLLADLEKERASKPQALEMAQLEQSKSELEANKRKLVQSIAEIATLTREVQALETEKNRLQKELAARPEVDAAELEKSLAAARESAKAEAANAASLRQKLEQEQKSWEQARAELEEKLSERVDGDGKDRIKDLEKERDELMKKLTEANRELYDVKARGELAQFQNLTNQVSNLRARLEVFEARKAPYTKEELALMDSGVPKLATRGGAAGNNRSVRELPAGSGDLVAQAEAAFARRRFAEAEEKYQEVLRLDEDNPVTLGNLAAIQLEQEKVAEAERNLNRALQLNPDDAYALSLLGMVRFREQKFEEALDLLSRAARRDPNNPETQNYLGITLSQQGRRDPAEAALRKAIQLAPNYAGAHHNIAVIYATQKPPFMELAKYHYNKAISLGQPANPELEKQLGLGQ